MNYATTFSILTITGVEPLNDGIYALIPLAYFYQNESSTESTEDQQVIFPETQYSTHNVQNATSHPMEIGTDAPNAYPLSDITTTECFGTEQVINHENPNCLDSEVISTNNEDNLNLQSNQDVDFSTNVQESSSNGIANNIELNYKNFISILRISKRGEKVNLEEIKSMFESENIQVTMNQIRSFVNIALKKKTLKKYGKSGQRRYKIV